MKIKKPLSKSRRPVSQRSGKGKPLSATPLRTPGAGPPRTNPPYHPRPVVPVAHIAPPKAYIGLEFNEWIFPGKPIPITVTFWSYDQQVDLGTGCRIRILNGTDVLLDLPQDTQYIPYKSLSNGLRADIGSFQAVISPPAPYSMPGKRLYLVGLHNLDLEITTNGADAGPYTGTFPLYVLGEAINSSWWSWNGTKSMSADWKEPYVLSGICTNRSQWSGMQFVLGLDEQRDTGGFNSLSILSSPHLESAESSPLLQFPSITQDWEWLEPGVWITKDALFHDFNYIVNLFLLDDYGNQYLPVASDEAEVWVTVPGKKVDFAAAAAGTFIGAAVLTVVAGFFPWVGVAAAAAGIAASVLGAQALDPRPPSPRFLETVEPATYVRPKLLRTTNEHPETVAFFLILLDMLACLEALTEVDARLRGAREKSSLKGIKLQQSSYRRIVRRLLSEVVPLLEAAATSADAVVESGVFNSKTFKSRVSDRHRLSLALSAFLSNIKVTGKSRTEALELVSGSRSAFSAKGMRQLFTAVALHVANVALMVKREENSILSQRNRS